MEVLFQKNKFDGFMIGREAIKNIFVFNVLGEHLYKNGANLMDNILDEHHIEFQEETGIKYGIQFFINEGR
jgi:tRNA-dihydrouridine synthase